jgi:hypothetical protein
MTRYYFDVLEDGRFSADTEGTELPNLEAARTEATLALCGSERVPSRRRDSGSEAKARD